MTYSPNSILIFCSILVFFLSFICCYSLAKKAKSIPLILGQISDMHAVQSMHAEPTPRVGGVVVVLSFSLGLVPIYDVLTFDILAALIAGVFVFLVGIREDISRDMPPKVRLIAAFVSAGTAIYLSSVTISFTDFRVFDWLLTYTPVVILVTLIFSAGFCHALNLIDGLNGLASGFAMTALLGICGIAYVNNQHDILYCGIVLIAAIAGFFVLNWPTGKIFLGDAGAYAIAHIIFWLAVILFSRVPAATSLSIVLIFFWPLIDTAFTVLRRIISGCRFDRPDRLHFHHLVIRLLLARYGDRLSKETANGLGTLLQLPFVASPVLAGFLFWNKPIYAGLAILIFTIAYIGAYRLTKSVFFKQRLKSTDYEIRKNDTTSDRAEFEVSNLSGIFIQDSLSVDVRIVWKRTTSKWYLRSEAHNASGRKWNMLFDTDYQAWDEFIDTVSNEGMEAVVGV